ncbi:hypothetical protein ACHAXA_008347 [Cyclostephanos tholiformis]|uniref:2-C-methyl-D-erythritol 4-phosphate cytidylyltransferase n=1 Tax=Cyclostephanos tholiformis TaxID=382380 RepID=A0ABD3R6Z0_9STRA
MSPASPAVMLQYEANMPTLALITSVVNDSNDVGPNSASDASSASVDPCTAAPDMVDDGTPRAMVGFSNGIIRSSRMGFLSGDRYDDRSSLDSTTTGRGADDRGVRGGGGRGVDGGTTGHDLPSSSASSMDGLGLTAPSPLFSLMARRMMEDDDIVKPGGDTTTKPGSLLCPRRMTGGGRDRAVANWCENLSPPRHVVLVMDPTYQPQYREVVDAYGGKLSFANPGKERQGSVENGLRALLDATGGDDGDGCAYVAIHDSARPLVTIREVLDVVRDAHVVGAAVLGVPCKATIKESGDGVYVTRTVPRSRLWEVHTPQVVRCEALLRGFEMVDREKLEVTDDVSIIEALGEPVRLTRGEYTNLKITTPEDMDVASAILADRGEGEIYLAGCDLGGGGGGGGGGGEGEAAIAVASKNPFASIPRAGHLREREYNTLREVKLFDRDVTGQRYPAKPTPSRWLE